MSRIAGIPDMDLKSIEDYKLRIIWLEDQIVTFSNMDCHDQECVMYRLQDRIIKLNKLIHGNVFKLTLHGYGRLGHGEHLYWRSSKDVPINLFKGSSIFEEVITVRDETVSPPIDIRRSLVVGVLLRNGEEKDMTLEESGITCITAPKYIFPIEYMKDK